VLIGIKPIGYELPARCLSGSSIHWIDELGERNPPCRTPDPRNSTKVPKLPGLGSPGQVPDDEQHVQHEGAHAAKAQAEGGDLFFGVAETSAKFLAFCRADVGALTWTRERVGHRRRPALAVRVPAGVAQHGNDRNQAQEQRSQAQQVNTMMMAAQVAMVGTVALASTARQLVKTACERQPPVQAKEAASKSGIATTLEANMGAAISPPSANQEFKQPTLVVWSSTYRTK